MTIPPHPCFECPLPDCDETSPRCALKRVLNITGALYKRGDKPDSRLRQQANIAYMELYGTRHNERRRAKTRGETA